MAALRQYFDTDFNSSIRLHVSFQYDNDVIECALLYEVSAATAFLICYIPNEDAPFEYFLGLLKAIEFGRTQLTFDHQVKLPSGKEFPGELRFQNLPKKLIVEYRLFGDPAWKNVKDIKTTNRIFIYSETNLSDKQIAGLQIEAIKLGHDLQFRDKQYVEGRIRFEKPIAFISHDSRDKNQIAQPIAITLQKMMCPVWYDDFSLVVGDGLRESIEKGLKECKKCILVLSPYFLTNNGWTKKEFNSIFTREILEDTRLVLPIWHGVTKNQVYEYCPSLLDVKAIHWDESKVDDICRQLYRVITD